MARQYPLLFLNQNFHRLITLNVEQSVSKLSRSYTFNPTFLTMDLADKKPHILEQN